MSHISEARLAAYIAVNETIKSLAHDAERMTIGEIVDVAVDATELACLKGQLGLQIMEFERDPDEGVTW